MRASHIIVPTLHSTVYIYTVYTLYIHCIYTIYTLYIIAPTVHSSVYMHYAHICVYALHRFIAYKNCVYSQHIFTAFMTLIKKGTSKVYIHCIHALHSSTVYISD